MDDQRGRPSTVRRPTLSRSRCRFRSLQTQKAQHYSITQRYDCVRQRAIPLIVSRVPQRAETNARTARRQAFNVSALAEFAVAMPVGRREMAAWRDDDDRSDDAAKRDRVRMVADNIVTANSLA